MRRKALTECSGWAPFEPMDEVRRFGGKLSDALGLGPVESPFRILLRTPAMTLRAYSGPKAQGPVVLIVPAPIKGAYIWDLLPGASAVQEFLRSGARVYLMQWNSPGSREQALGLAEYAGSLILESLKVIQREAESGHVILAGHSLGGTFAAIFAALHPEAVGALLLLAAPVHFGPEVDALSALAACSPPAPILTQWLGRVSGSFLSVVSLAASPTTFGYSRCRDWWASLPEPQALRTHLGVERWTCDELSLPRRLFEEVVEWLYREDRFMRGTLEIGGRRAKPQRVRASLLCVTEARSAVAPPASARPFYEAARSPEKQWLVYEGDVGVSLQHVGMLVGRSAHATLWPAIAMWVRRLGRMSFGPHPDPQIRTGFRKSA